MIRKYRKPYRVKKRKSIWENRFFWLGILILIIFGGIFYLICFHSFFQLKVIQISGNQKVATENLENLIREKISQRVLFFPTKSIFFTNLNEINKDILEKFPQIAQVNLDREFPNTILAQIEERKPVAIFCYTQPEGDYPNCFFIDKEGIIFEKILEIDPQFLKIKNLALTTELQLGEKIIEKKLLSQILEVEGKLKNELKIFSEEILVVSEERFNVKTSEGWQIYFNFREDLGWQLTKLKAVLEKEIPLERRKDLEYIDLRFGNFAPYKYKD